MRHRYLVLKLRTSAVWTSRAAALATDEEFETFEATRVWIAGQPVTPGTWYLPVSALQPGPEAEP